MIHKLPVSSGWLKQDLYQIQDQAELQLSCLMDYENRSNIVKYLTDRKRSVWNLWQVQIGETHKQLKQDMLSEAV